MENDQELIELEVEEITKTDDQSKKEEKQNQNKIEISSSRRRMEFKQFDIIVSTANDDDNKKNKNDVSIKDHHYAYSSSSPDQQKKYYNGRTDKNIMKEWEILKEGLPDSIYVRVYESRIDLLRAVIIGPAGTPYHDNLFFFDFQFPSDYPNKPPKFHYLPPLRDPLNPNLRPSGSVRLSLLNVMFGKDNERWDSENSNVLQILLLIKYQVLNPKPYHNNFAGYTGRSDPPVQRLGYTRIASPTDEIYRERYSLACNREAFELSCRTALKLLAKPPSHFEGFVARHFRERAETILIACKACLNGGVHFGEEDDDTQYSPNSSAVMHESIAAAAAIVSNDRFVDLYPKLVNAFVDNGSSLENYVSDCAEHRSHCFPIVQNFVNFFCNFFS